MDGVDYWKSPGDQAQEEKEYESRFITGMAGGQDSDGSGSLSSPIVGTESSPGSRGNEAACDTVPPALYLDSESFPPRRVFLEMTQ
jgi:hypothetical protein